MQISTVLSLFYIFLSLSSSTIQGFEPSPAPIPGTGAVSPAVEFSAPLQASSGSPAPDSGDGVGSPSLDLSPPSPTPSESPAPVTVESNKGVDRAPAPVPAAKKENSGDVAPSPPVPEETGSETVRWCAVRDEFVDCQYFVSLLRQSEGYTWKCVRRDTTQECLDSIKKGEADLINLEAGLAYTAFLNYTMKAIANEVYCDHTESYDAVAVVNRKACKDEEGINLMDFKGQKSCHGGYSTAAGWNYPINYVKKLFDSEKMNDWEMASSFFSGVCAPSEFEGSGICSGCGNENGSCHSNSLYVGHSGAFRCLVEELGDIAFVKGDTALLYSMEGPHNQSWSTKSVRDFMYLCPHGGCREINGYPGACSFGTVPANVIMTSNSLLNKKRLVILQTLLNATWINALYAGKNEEIGHFANIAKCYLDKCSLCGKKCTQGLDVVKKLTRSYLGKSASVSQSIQELNTQKVQDIPSTVNSISDVSSPSSTCVVHIPLVITFLSILTVLVLLVFSPI